MSNNVAAQGHLPECPQIAEPPGGNGPFYGPCICPALRVREARVREEEQVAQTLAVAAALLAQDRQQMEELADMADANMGYGRIRYEEGRADERAELWRLLEPLVTEMAMRNTGGTR